jgi:pimeloyl-ACP methyl ester carboxylesterase
MKKAIQYLSKQICYTISGSGPTLVLLHGFLESKEIWDDFLAILQKEFTVIAIDLPGHGETELLSEKHSMSLMAEAVKSVFEAEKIEKAVLAGHSMGGYVALQFAVDNEEFLNGLILFHSHANADSDEAKTNRQRTIEIVQQNHGGFIRQFIPDLFDQNHVEEYTASIQKLQDMAAQMAPEAIIAALAGMRDRLSQTDYLAEAKIPVLFIMGKQDSRMPYAQLISQALIPVHSEILLLGNVGHMGYLEAPGITLPALRHFTMRCFNL